MCDSKCEDMDDEGREGETVLRGRLQEREREKVEFTTRGSDEVRCSFRSR